MILRHNRSASADPLASARPRNRRQLIAEAAGSVFSERGYHAASMEEIAAKVGISAPALYRHFPNKYALFAECANTTVDGLVGALDGVPPEADLTEVLRAATHVAVTRRTSGGLYRWEARYLNPSDRGLLRAKFARVVDRVTEAVRREHDSTSAELRAVAALGVIGSITMHRVSISQHRAESELLAAALRVASTEPSTSAGAADAAPAQAPARPVPRARRDEILAAAIPLFAKDGFAKVTNGQIAKAVGVVPSAIYRHYPTKVDILAAACLQAADLLSQAVTQGLEGIDDPHEALVALAATYVAYSFEHTELTSIAEAEVVGLPDGVRQPLIRAQRDHISLWEQHLVQVRRELTPRQARLLVHAGFGVVVEAGRRLCWQDTPDNRSRVVALVIASLGLR
ncbi:MULTISPECIES: TetR/AcrR family transcriptional regulator [Streptomyces]|uniref:TetR/AcrR family transcriptional regulator n=1 Tax=Streptomyces TaxID=1883 RepID=UPI0006AD5BD0|nr:MULTISPECIES: TetR/AcrR family transcriptional regulator [Streptomyces]ALC26913.1 TetR family transcriptional regulator [Streptomyces sp. CFMR 7]RZF09649.1 TetR/AcrR family transcriptional regulator [Streptomyces albidoflavus]